MFTLEIADAALAIGSRSTVAPRTAAPTSSSATKSHFLMLPPSCPASRYGAGRAERVARLATCLARTTTLATANAAMFLL